MTVALDDPRATIGDTVRLARPATRGLVLSTLLGAACIASAIGLLGTSAWLISRCAQHGSVADLGLAVVSVRFFALSRGLFRYGERLVGHDSAFRALARLRVDVYARLERVAPAGLQRFRRGDLLTRVVEDVDALQDVALRVLPAWCIAAVVGVATTFALLLILPAAALAVGVALLVAATAVPWTSRTLARRTEARRAPARGALTASVIDLLEGAPDLVAFAATDAHVRRLVEQDAELTAISAARARTAGVGSGLIALCTGLAMWLALVLGVSAVHAGRLQGVMLAVVALVPLAAFELVVPLPAAAQALEGAQRSAGRLNGVMDQPLPVLEPASPKTPERAIHHGLDIRGLRARYSPDAPWALDGIDLDLRGGRQVALVGASGAGKSTLASVLVRFLEYSGSVRLDGVEIRDLAGDDVRRIVGLVEQDAHVFDSTLRENVRLAKPVGDRWRAPRRSRTGPAARLGDDPPARP